ncbi:DUF397 domain-containing protein [Actinosynnema sp. NPDC050436]|uniref:DUF397 domain-containing protein n=1 Tax=Actinosynnema sp. NPDC050436 TaxID=3155659 RepID=UPI00340D82B0
MSRLQWIKSSYSSNNGACVEVASADHRVLARDSKNVGPSLSFPAASWRALTAGLAR